MGHGNSSHVWRMAMKLDRFMLSGSSSSTPPRSMDFSCTWKTLGVVFCVQTKFLSVLMSARPIGNGIGILARDLMTRRRLSDYRGLTILIGLNAAT